MAETTSPLVSVVVPTFNSSAYIADCLRSIYAQEGNFELDVIVVDDGSFDDTVSIIEGTGYKLRCVQQPNAGPAAARNSALAIARGEFIAFLDSDDIWPPKKLAGQLELLKAHPDIGLIFGDCRQFDSDGEFPKTLFESEQLDYEFWGDTLYVRDPYEKLLQSNFVTTGSILMRRACIDEVGVFDEGLRLVEDLEYWLRISLAFPIAHTDAVCLLRRRHAENTSRHRIAMAKAFLQVLQTHSRLYTDRIPISKRDLKRHLKDAHQTLGHMYSKDNSFMDGARSYWRAWRSKPNLRSLYYLLSAIFSAVSQRSQRIQ